jgi:hypothetical protein
VGEIGSARDVDIVRRFPEIVVNILFELCLTHGQAEILDDCID